MRRRVLIGFGIPLLLALLTSLVVERIVRAYGQDFGRVTSTTRTLGELNTLIKTVVDTETGERGFAITGDETFLEPYRSGLTSFGVTLSQLRRVLPDATSQDALDEIDALFERWHREVGSVVVAARRQAPVGLSDALSGASSAFYQAHILELRYARNGDVTLLTRWAVQVDEAQRELERALELNTNGPRPTAIRAAAEQLKRYRTAVEPGVPAAEGDANAPAQPLGNTLAQLAETAAQAEVQVSAIVRSGAGKRLIDSIRAQVDELSGRVNATVATDFALSSADARRTQWLAFAAPLFSALVSLLAIVQAQQHLTTSVSKLAKVAKAVAAGQLERRLSLSKGDELRPLAEDFNRMAEQLSERDRQNAQLGQFSATLQVCTTMDEAYRVTSEFGPQLFGALAGTLYLVSASRNLLEGVVSWGDYEAPTEETLVYTPADCWALRRGGPQGYATGRGVACVHTPIPAPSASLCVPLVNQDETLGVLYLFSRVPGVTLDDTTEAFAVTIAESLTLTLSNLRLRESLQRQSVRDPLTGLFNRRHLEETLELELHRSARRGEPLSVVMFDVDHFKVYNDTFGHNAGDLVLQQLSKLVQQCIRAGDVACRYGGEEFLLLQPGMSAEHAVRRAEGLREAAAKLALEYRGSTLQSVTLSLGVATYPDHTQSGAELIQRADEALYRAKRSGRNRTEVAEVGVTGESAAAYTIVG